MTENVTCLVIHGCDTPVAMRTANLLLLSLFFLAGPVAAADVPASAPASDVLAAAGFDLLEFAVEGNTTLPVTEVERAVYPYLGPGKTSADVELAREALERAYHDAGYLTVLVNIPEQKVADGVVSLRVTEGRVERLKVSGNRYFSRSDIRAEAPSLAPGEVPHFPEVQKELGRLGRSRDMKVAPLLRSGKAPGTVEVELTVDDSLPLHASVELNNKQSPDTEAGRLEASVHYNNLWQKRHTLGVNLFRSPNRPEQADIFGLAYSLPVGERNLGFYVMRSNSDIPATFDTRVLGKGTSAGLRLIQPLPTIRDGFHALSLGIDYKDFDQTILLAGVPVHQPIRYWPLSAQYSAALSDAGGEWRFQVGATLGLRGPSERRVDCGGVEMDQFECRRVGARSNFMTLRGELQRTQALGRWSLFAHVDGQAASQPLISNEQLVAGGFDSVRGYLEAERAGDDGLRARFELRAPSWELLDEPIVRGHLVGFLDWATLRLQQPLPGQVAETSLVSSGIGLHLRSGRGLAFSSDLARAHRDASKTLAGDWRWQVKFAYDF